MITRNMDYYNLDMIINPIKSRIKQYSSFEWRQVQSDTAVRNKNGSLNQQFVPHAPPIIKL